MLLRTGLGDGDPLVGEKRRAQAPEGVGERRRGGRSRRGRAPRSRSARRGSRPARAPRARVARVKRCVCERSRMPRSVYRQRPARSESRIAQFAMFGVERTTRPPGFEERPQAGERGHRVAEVLDDVAAEHDVEGARLERQLHRLDVADEHALADTPRPRARHPGRARCRRSCCRARRAAARGSRSSSRRRARACPCRPRRAASRARDGDARSAGRSRSCGHRRVHEQRDELLEGDASAPSRAARAPSTHRRRDGAAPPVRA